MKANAFNTNSNQPFEFYLKGGNTSQDKKHIKNVYLKYFQRIINMI